MMTGSHSYKRGDDEATGILYSEDVYFSSLTPLISEDSKGRVLELLSSDVYNNVETYATKA